MEPQKGPDVTIAGLTSKIPVITGDVHTGGNTALMYKLVNENTTLINPSIISLRNGTITNASSYTSAPITEPYDMEPNNLWAVTDEAVATSINVLRQAFAVQRLYEKDARAGSRYREVIRAHFGVVSPDARMQVPEYLGGARHPINVDQVIQMSETTATSPQGNTAAYSLTNFIDKCFTKSFTEHGYIIGLAAIRTMNTYQQGLERMWSKKSRFDFYWPSLANIGEQPIYNKEIYAQGNSADDEVFGYQEAWADYRYKPSRVSGAFRSNYEQTLDSWHYASYFESQPYLSSEWIDETRENVNRTIAVQDELEDQFIADFYFKNIVTRPMPLYSLPGLIDHH